jgi:hypothetical protein
MITVIPEFAEGEYPGPGPKTERCRLRPWVLPLGLLPSPGMTRSCHAPVGLPASCNHRNSEDKENDDALTIGGDFSAIWG